jgi:hypothetical protein
MVDETNETNESSGGGSSSGSGGSSGGGGGSSESLGSADIVEAVGSTGNVFLFNTTPQDGAQIVLNGTYVNTISAAKAQANNYAPSYLKVARIQASTTQIGQFADSNVLEFGGNNNQYYAVNLPTRPGGQYFYPYANDVLIYIFDGYIVIGDTYGDNLQYVPAGGSFSSPGQPTALPKNS